MKTLFNPAPSVRLLALASIRPSASSFRRASITLCCLLMALPASARDLFGIPLPPPPHEVIREIRGKIHRAAGELKSAGRRAVAEVAHDDDDDDDDGSVRHTNRARQSVRPAPPVHRHSSDRRYREHRTFDGEIGRRAPAPDRTSTRTNREMGDKEIARRRESANPPPRSSGDPLAVPQDENTMDARESAPHQQHSSPAQKSKHANENAIEFARPVPGKRGMVYPPGAKESSENMIDVEGFQPGQVVRDPRTGSLFKVP